MKGMLLAAGLGTRLRPVTDRIPKPAVPMLNVPMLLYNEYLLRSLELERLVVNTHHLPERIRELRPRMKVQDLVFSHEPQILGSGGGIWNAKKHLNDGFHFIVCNGDNIILPKRAGLLEQFMEFHKHHKALSTLMVMEHPDAGVKFNAVWADKAGNVAGIGKTKTGVGTKPYHFIGIQAFSPRIFEYLPEGESNIFQDAILPALQNEQRVLAFTAPVRWYETGDEKSYLDATLELANLLWSEESSFEKTFLQQLLQDLLPTMKIPARGEPFLGDGAQVENGATLEGIVVLGNRVRITKNSHLKDTVVLDEATLHDGVSLQNRLIF
ncbi:MAG TPA: NDP-sugar synthase [Bdellovibrionales bacterium]|nr:NDP-sugar synthase [Bdellovibrionales bacterium]